MKRLLTIALCLLALDAGAGVVNMRGRPSGAAAASANITNAWWTLDAVYTDSSGNGYTLDTISTNGAAKWANDHSAVARQAIYMDGSDRLTAVTNLNQKLCGKTSFSLVAWVKRTTIGDVDWLFGNNEASPAKRTLSWWFAADNKQYLITSNDGQAGTAKASTSTVADTNWHHMTVCFTNGTATFYKDGIVDGVQSGMEAPIYETTSPHCVGWVYGDSTAAYSFEGMIDDVKIYNRVLTSNEVWTLKNL